MNALLATLAIPKIAIYTLDSWWTTYRLTSWYISYESPSSLTCFSVNKIVVLLQVILPTSNKAVRRQWSKCDSSVRLQYYFYTCTYILLVEEILHQLRLVVYPIIYKALYIPSGCLGFLNHHQYHSHFPLHHRFNIPRNSPGTSRKISSPFPESLGPWRNVTFMPFQLPGIIGNMVGAPWDGGPLNNQPHIYTLYHVAIYWGPGLPF